MRRGRGATGAPNEPPRRMIGPGRAFALAFIATGGALLALLTVKGGVALMVVSALSLLATCAGAS